MEQANTNSNSDPRFSVVIASKVGAPFIDHCLDSVADQAKMHDAEVIVVVAEDAPYASRLEADYPWTRLVRTTETKVPAMRRVGVDASSGQWVAVIEEHCSAKDDWLQQASAGLSSGQYSAVGGPIVDYGYEKLRDWTVYFLEYNGAMPPAPDGQTNDLNDANIAYPRSLLLEHRDLLDEGYWPMTLHGTLLAKDHRLLSLPEMVVYHRGPFPFAYYLGQRYLFSRAYTGVRAQSKSIFWRLTYLIAAPVIPLMLLGRIAKRVFAKRCHVPKFVLSLPFTIIAMIVLVAGEWVGCLLGPGDALTRVE